MACSLGCDGDTLQSLVDNEDDQQGVVASAEAPLQLQDVKDLDQVSAFSTGVVSRS